MSDRDAEISTPHADEIAAALARVRMRRGGRPSGGDATGEQHRHNGEQGCHGAHGAHGPHHDHGDCNAPPRGREGGRFGGPARMRMLEALFAASEPLSVGEIAEAVGVDQPRASRLVQQCVEHEVARREVDPTDARRSRVALTDRGYAIVQEFTQNRRGAIDAALAGFSGDERADLARLLTKFADAWPR